MSDTAMTPERLGYLRDRAALRPPGALYALMSAGEIVEIIDAYTTLQARERALREALNAASEALFDGDDVLAQEYICSALASKG